MPDAGSAGSLISIVGLFTSNTKYMKTKQLANVLIKVLGLSVVVHSIPAVITGLFSAVQIRGAAGPGAYWLYPVSSLVLVAIGIYLIIKSKDVVEFLFKNEDE